MKRTKFPNPKKKKIYNSFKTVYIIILTDINICFCSIK